METRTARLGGWPWRASAVRAMSVLAVAGALLGSVVNPAAAGWLDVAAGFFGRPKPATADTGVLGDPSTPLRLDFFKLHCTKERGDDSDGHDEPYLVVFAADLSGPIPRSDASRSVIFGNVDSKETHFQNRLLQLWDFDGTGAPILDPARVIFLCALLESNESASHADAVRIRVAGELHSKLIDYYRLRLSPDLIASRLASDMNLAITAHRGKDQRIGGIGKVSLSLADVLQARRGFDPQVIKTLRFVDSEADYTATFVLQTTIFVIN